MRSHGHVRHVSDPTGPISRYGVNLANQATSHGITISRHDVLEASHTRKASPLLAGLNVRNYFRTGQINYPTRNFARALRIDVTARIALPFNMQSLHVAMQRGPYLHPVSWMSGVWPLRILIKSAFDFLRFIVSTISAISMSPVCVR